MKSKTVLILGGLLILGQTTAWTGCNVPDTSVQNNAAAANDIMCRWAWLTDGPNETAILLDTGDVYEVSDIIANYVHPDIAINIDPRIGWRASAQKIYLPDEWFPEIMAYHRVALGAFCDANKTVGELNVPIYLPSLLPKKGDLMVFTGTNDGLDRERDVFNLPTNSHVFYVDNDRFLMTTDGVFVYAISPPPDSIKMKNANKKTLAPMRIGGSPYIAEYDEKRGLPSLLSTCRFQNYIYVSADNGKTRRLKIDKDKVSWEEKTISYLDGKNAYLAADGKKLLAMYAIDSTTWQICRSEDGQTWVETSKFAAKEGYVPEAFNDSVIMMASLRYPKAMGYFEKECYAVYAKENTEWKETNSGRFEKGQVLFDDEITPDGKVRMLIGESAKSDASAATEIFNGKTLLVKSIPIKPEAQSKPATRTSDDMKVLVAKLADVVKNWRPMPKELNGRFDVVLELWKTSDLLNKSERSDLLCFAPGIESQMKPNQRWIFSTVITAFYVQVATSDVDADIRQYASDLLSNCVPSRYITIHASAIIKAAEDEKFENALLLGKTGAVEARRLLAKGGKLWSVDECQAKAALAKLGDVEFSKEFVDAYAKEIDPRKKANLAATLGYIGDASCVLALARDMRTSAVYSVGAWTKSMRLAIIAALSEVYPDESVFWYRKDASVLKDVDAWYDEVEKWIEGHLGITWQNLRPAPFKESVVPTVK